MTARPLVPLAVERPETGAVLVFAPHADDELIGCGGTLALHLDQGDAVRVVVVFDGALGVAHMERAQAACVRQAEARTAAARLAGGGDLSYEFWGYPEGHEPSEHALRRAAREMRSAMDEFRPTSIYVPWVGEQHLDHRSVARALHVALASGPVDASVWSYEVWSPLVAERVVDVTTVFDRKLEALREHKSQLVQRDLLHCATGLGAQRSLFLPVGRYGEAFRRLRTKGVAA